MQIPLAASVPRIDVTPQPALFDDILHICLRDCGPGRVVTLKASMIDERDRTWISEATFVADQDGCVDLAMQSPLAGTYSGVNPMGLCWSATTQRSRRGTFLKRGSEPLFMQLTAEIDGMVVVSNSVQRHIIAPHVERIAVRERGFVGTFFRQVGGSARPAVLVFGGAEGGLHEGRAALLASWGYPALALAYFGMEHLPAELARIPLEYFETALTWLGEQEGVDRHQLVLMGTSRGGEAALLLGATFSEKHPVIAIVPCGLVWESESASSYQPAWLRNGREAMAYLRWPGNSPTAEVNEAEMRSYLEANPEICEEATIPVERIGRPLLVISGTDDRIWPTTYFCERIITHLKEKRYPFPYQHIAYQDAGHLFTLPHLPTTLVWHGGSAEAMARANVDYWHQIRVFLDMLP